MAIISVFLLGPMAYTAEAAVDQGALKAALDSIKGNPCIDTEGSDAGYIITFIEEPLDTQTSPDQEGDFIYRTCFRNTFQYTLNLDSETVKAKTEVLSFVSTTCSSDAQNLLNDTAAVKEYNVRYSCKEIQAILSKGGTSLIYGYIGMIYKWAASIVGVISITVIILSGIQMSASGGDPEALSKSKTRIIQSISGIIILFLSGIILNTINPNFFTS